MLPIRIVLVLGLLMVVTPFIWAQSASSTDFYGSAIDKKEICASSSGFMSEQEVERLIADILAKQGLRNRFIVVECRSVENCLATVDKQKRPVILYNPDFLQRVKTLQFTGSDLPKISDRDWPSLTILAHEIGHHLNQHLTNPLPDATRRGMELEADQTAGYLLYLMGGRLEQGKLAFQAAPEKGGYEYPPRADRMKALETGFQEAMKIFPKTPPTTPEIRTTVKQDPVPTPYNFAKRDDEYLEDYISIIQREKEKKLEIDSLKVSADKGSAKSQYKLGYNYFYGEGVAKDYTQARYWFRKAAEIGDSKAQARLGVMYLNGIGIYQDLIQAENWLRKSAEQNDALGLYNLGIMYERGLGVEKNLNNAIQLYKKAVDQYDLGPELVRECLQAIKRCEEAIK